MRGNRLTRYRRRMTTHLADLNGPLAKLADAHCVIAKDYAADFLALAWYRVAPLPTGKFAVMSGGWCQGVGTFDEPWHLRDTLADCVREFVAAAKDLCHRAVEGGLADVQEKARRRLWAKIVRDTAGTADLPLEPPLLQGTLSPPPTGDAVEQAVAHRRQLLALARKVTGDVHEASDAVQDALVGLLKYPPAADPARSLLPYLTTVVINAARTRMRKDRSNPQSDALPEPVDERADPTARIERAELVARVKAATWGLEPVSREAFRLCYLQGLTHQEIARRLKCQLGRVNGLICRARKALRRELAEA